MESPHSEALKLRLVQGERLESVLGLESGASDPDNVLVLTNTRLALVKMSGRQRRSTVTSVRDIETVEVAEVRPGVGVVGDVPGRSPAREVTVVDRDAWQSACRELGQEVPWTARRAASRNLPRFA